MLGLAMTTVTGKSTLKAKARGLGARSEMGSFRMVQVHGWSRRQEHNRRELLEWHIGRNASWGWRRNQEATPDYLLGFEPVCRELLHSTGERDRGSDVAVAEQGLQ